MSVRRKVSSLGLLLLMIVGLSACDSGGDDPGVDPEDTGCIIPTNLLNESTGIDAIPALTDPLLVDVDAVDYLRNSDLVLGFHLGDLTVAVPHNILNWHEVINFNQTTPRVAITFCPLTGSGLAFDRAGVNNAEFGVSGLIYLNNNVVYDRRESQSLWSQMGALGVCGDAAGTVLQPLALIEMTWEGWRTLYPETKVLSTDTGFERNYQADPLVEYKELHDRTILFPMPNPIDTRRPPKERVLGIPDGVGVGGLAFPLTALDNGAPFRVVHATMQGAPLVVFYDRARQAAAAYHLDGDQAQRTFVVRDGQIIDTETESVWQIDGRATSGSLEGRRLTPIDEAYISFWFAWAAFQPQAVLWTDGA